MKSKLRDDWFQISTDPAMNMDQAGVYQWSIDGVGVYVGKAKVLRKRLFDYPRNVLAMIEGRPWHGNPAKWSAPIEVVRPLVWLLSLEDGRDGKAPEA